MITLMAETGTFIISSPLDSKREGAISFFFKGDDSFINRMTNFCYNYGLTENGKIYKYQDFHFYVYTTLTRLKDALVQLFKAEIIQSHKNIDYQAIYDEELGSDVTWNEQKVNDLAEEEFKNFWASKIISQNLLINYASTPAFIDELGMGYVNDMGIDPITE